MSFQKATQLLHLARLVASRHMGVTLADVEEEFGCSERTAQRIFGALADVFPQLESGFDAEGRKRWRLDSQHVREFISFTPEERAALEGAARQLGSSHLKELHAKLLMLVPQKSWRRIEPDYEALMEAQGVVARPGPRPRINVAIQDALLHAIKACEIIVLDYRSHNDKVAKPRHIAPYGILSGARRYLVGRPMNRPADAAFTYRLDMIEKVTPSGKGFMRPETFDLQAFADRSFGAFQSEDEYSEIVWRFLPEAADHARGHMFHPNQTLQPQPDGSLIVRFEASGLLEMTWYLYAWGDKVEVLAPARLKEMVGEYRRSDFPALP